MNRNKKSSGTVLTFWGTCAGTEPIAGRHHTSFTMAHRDRLYWFDAGENCSYRAYLSGADLPATEALFISHTHMDHIGGLPNLLWTLRKLTSVSAVHRRRMAGRTIDLFIPDRGAYEGMLQMLRATEGGYTTVFELVAHPCHDGVLFDRDGFRVRALHNHHLGKDPPYRSYSFRIETGECSVVYSGDIRDPREIDSLVGDCDYLLIETGHHQVEAICRYLIAAEKRFGQLVFLHHGRPWCVWLRGGLEERCKKSNVVTCATWHDVLLWLEALTTAPSGEKGLRAAPSCRR